MNRGAIPGFYYDEEKKKYFKITANYAAPVNAKYSKSNVKREEQEKRALKKRKLDERQSRKQTVHQASALRSGLLQTTLQRELGNLRYASLCRSRNDSLVSGLEYRQIVPRVKGFNKCPTITDAHYASDRSCMLLAATHSAGASCVYSYDWEDDVGGVQNLTEKRPLVALPGVFVTMQHIDSTLLLVSNTSHAIQYYLGPSDPAERTESTLFPTANLQNTVNTVHACAFDHATHNIAFAGTGLLVVNGMSPGYIGRCSFGETKESFAVTWLQPNVLAYGLQTEISKRPSQHTVCLWDVRVGYEPSPANSSTRLKRRNRVTGVATVANNDHHLLVSSNLDISLYDLRMHAADGPPLLSIPHTSAGPRFNFAVQDDLIAAVDEQYKVKVYSFQTGRHLRTLQRDLPACSYGPPLQQLRWQENRRGSPYLQACADSIVHKWEWSD
ncbi:putative WD40/YVTN repeat-like-containing domain superfamily [Septoria linicola]|nr:putative WD40/YVTN repeat-like-containing domain superfamily [Septoria linicola]